MLGERITEEWKDLSQNTDAKSREWILKVAIGKEKEDLPTNTNHDSGMKEELFGVALYLNEDPYNQCLICDPDWGRKALRFNVWHTRLTAFHPQIGRAHV